MHGTQETFLWWIVMSKVDKNEWLRTQNIKKNPECNWYILNDFIIHPLKFVS